MDRPVMTPETRDRAAAWGITAYSAPHRWQASLAVVATLVLYETLPGKLQVGPWWIVPALELALVLPLALTGRQHVGPRWERPVAVTLIAVANAVNVVSLALLVHFLILGGGRGIGSQLLIESIKVWLTNVLAFALWYWELDRGGPRARGLPEHREPAFLFPQMSTPGCAPTHWAPHFADYLYVSFTNATAFSPTDTMPLTRGAKMLMLIQALASLLTIALVAARAVNILTT